MFIRNENPVKAPAITDAGDLNLIKGTAMTNNFNPLEVYAMTDNLEFFFKLMV